VITSTAGLNSSPLKEQSRNERFRREATRQSATNTEMKTAELPTTSRKERQSSEASDLGETAVTEIAQELRQLLSDVFVLFVKTKNFHWHMSGPHFRDYHLLLDEQAGELFSMTDVIAERGRKLGGATLRSISDIARHQRLQDNDAACVLPQDMLAELTADNRQLTRLLRRSHDVCDQHHDVATASLIENWIDQAERRAWFLSRTAENR
jgi:starvation-inducible DNA-binding protein